MNWVYLVSGIDPPTGFNTTLWPYLLDDREQQAVVNRLGASDGPVCYLRSGLDSGWMMAISGPVDEDAPLWAYLMDPHFRRVDESDGLQLFMKP